MKNKRIDWVDLARGIGIILVVIGHCVYYGHFTHNWIFSFHMQLFFMLSGLFFKKGSIVSVVKKKVKQLLVPYLIFCIIGLCITMIVPQWRGITTKGLIRDIYWGYPVSVNVSSVWFLVCLFVTTILFDAILLIMDKNIIVGYAALGIVGIYGFLLVRFPVLLSIFPGARMPWESDSACVAVIFFAAGYFFKEFIFSLEEKTNGISMVNMFIFTSFLLLGTLYISVTNGTVNLRGLVYNNELLYITGGLLGFLFCMFLSLTLKKINCGHLVKLIRWFGVNSLKIMGVQAIVVRFYLLFLNYFTGESYGLYLLPKRYSLIGSVFVIICSGVIVMLYNKMFKVVCRLGQRRI